MDLSVKINAPRLLVSFGATRPSLSVGTPVVVEYRDTNPYLGQYDVNPTEEEQTLETNGLRMIRDVEISAIPSDYVGSAIPHVSDLSVDGLTVTAPRGFYEEPVSVEAIPLLEDVSVSPDESVQTITSGLGFDGLGEVTVEAIPSDYVGSEITRRSSLTRSGPTVTAPAGYYERTTSTSVLSAGWKNNLSKTVNPTISVSAVGKITASYSVPEMLNPISSDGWATSTDSVNITLKGTNSRQLDTIGTTTINPTESQQTAVNAGTYAIGPVRVGAIPSDYIGSAVTTRTSLSVSGSTVSALSGVYSGTVSTSVSSASWDGDASVTANPMITIDTANGTISASVSKVATLSPVSVSGWADSGQTYTANIGGSASTSFQFIHVVQDANGGLYIH